MNKMYKRKYFSIKLLPKVKPLLIILIKLNLINFVKITDGNYYTIFPNLHTKLKLTPMSRKGYQYISYENIEKVLLKKRWTAIISTSKGLRTTKQCVREKMGGILVFNIMCDD